VEEGAETSVCFCEEPALGPEVWTGARVGAVVECLPVVHGGMVRNSSKERTW